MGDKESTWGKRVDNFNFAKAAFLDAGFLFMISRGSNRDSIYCCCSNCTIGANPALTRCVDIFYKSFNFLFYHFSALFLLMSIFVAAWSYYSMPSSVLLY